MPEIINIDDAINMMETMLTGLVITMTFDLTAWLGLQNKKEYVVVKDLGLQWSGLNSLGYMNYYRVINDHGKLVDVSDNFCKVSRKKD